MIRLMLIMLLGLLSACASTPTFDTTGVDKTLNPQRVISESELTLDKLVLWGGTILDVKNMKDSTRIEMLSYPLSSSQKPRLQEKPLGRFIIKHQGYLEPEIFSPGKSLSVKGRVGPTIRGKVGDSDYIYPIIVAEKIQLWSKGGEGSTRFQFGLGIHLSN